MKYLTIFLLLSSLLFISCSDDDNPVETNNDALIKEATDFSLYVVNCYFTKDTSTYRTYLPEMLYVINPDEPPYETSYFILSNYFESYDYSTYNLETYKDTYDYELMEYDVYNSKYGEFFNSLQYWKPTKEDFLFFGHMPKKDKVPFMYYEPLIFFVTKSSGEWKIRAIQKS